MVNQELSLVAASHGLFYAPDPSSQKACTIGGNAAENSGGPHCLYYGVTTNHVLGMEVVLADGSVHWVSGDAPDRVGLDLCGVLVGSEGTLCAITKIKVRLLRIPPSVATLLAAFPTIETASLAVSAVIARGIVPAALEMMDHVTVGAVEAHYHAGYPTDAGAVLLVEVDGIAESTRELMVAIREVLEENEGYALREAQTPAERDLLWAGRKGAIGALGRIKPNYYLHDGVVPRSRLPQVLSAVGEIGEHYKLPVANVFHAGDGNLHPNILFDLRDRDVLHAGRGRGRGDAARGRGAWRRAVGRARHRAREERLHAVGLQPRRPRRHATRQARLRRGRHPQPRQDLSRPDAQARPPRRSHRPRGRGEVVVTAPVIEKPATAEELARRLHEAAEERVCRRAGRRRQGRRHGRSRRCAVTSSSTQPGSTECSSTRRRTWW